MTAPDKQLSESLEDYMEAIFHIEEQKHAARAKDIAERLQVSNSSVTGALRLLSEKGLINYAPYDIITLTPDGKKVAQDVVQRHEIFARFFIKILAVNEADADEAACKMEHGVSPIILDRITQFIQFLEKCPRGERGWLEKFGTYCQQGKDTEECRACLAQCIDELRQKWLQPIK